MITIRFTVPGPVRGKGRPRFAKVGGFVRTYTDKDTASYENRVMLCFKAENPGHKPIPAGVPVDLRITATFTVPKSWSKRRRSSAEFQTGRPDADNIVKLVADSLNGVAWHDDAQVSNVAVHKVYGDEPGVFVAIAWDDGACAEPSKT
jgi:Holliday junction resolvase RusA-like endonuclease